MKSFLTKNSRLTLMLVLIAALLTATGVLAATNSWQNIGSAGFSAGSAYYISLALDGGTPYVAYMDGGNSDKATVMRYNGTSWETVGSAGFSAGGVYYTSLALDGSGTPYVAYTDGGNDNKATVMRYNSTTGWETVGSAGFSAGAAGYTSLAFYDSTPYVAYRDGGNGSRATVMKFNGAIWETVGSAGFSAGQASYTSLALDGSTPYVAYRDRGNLDKATVKKFNGAIWETVGLAGFSAGEVWYTSLALDGGGTPYVAYMDGGNSDKATVMAYGSVPSVATSSPANGATIQSTNTLIVDFSEDMLHDGSVHAADNVDNYLLVEANGNGFQTTSCSAGVDANDSKIAILSADYDNNGGGGPYRATLIVAPLENGSYRLLVCGSTSICNLSGFVLNGGTDSIINFTVADEVQAKALPQTGFAPGVITQLPKQDLSSAYQQFNYVSLEIPTLGVEAPIVGVPISQHGWDLTWLGDQAGWLHGTAFPSWAGNSAITAHVVDANGQPGLFSDLSELNWGDEVIVHAYGQDYVYEVRTVEKYVQPDDTSSVFRHEDYPWLTLITCQGYDEDSDSYRWRIAVRAVQTKIK